MTSSSRPAIVRTFMTHEMSDSDIVAVSTGREAEFKRIMGAISRSRAASPGTLQHVVLYGSRGFGKSFMMRRVEIALGQHDHGDGPVRFLLLPEEQHNLQKSPYALLTYITVLLKQQDSDAAFEEAKFQWPKPGEAARRWTEAAEKLEEALDHSLPNGQGLVVVAVENFDTLLATLFAEEEDEQRLREWLFRSGNRLMLLATATGTVDMDYDRPLFQAFETVRLTPWTTEDCITYFNRKRESEGKPPLDAPQEAKARAVAEFIGGTPRLAQLLGEVIETEDALSVSATMDALADRLAEYYRRRIEDLGPLVRGLLDALIRGGEPASQTELAQRVDADGQNQIARAMADLQRADIVRGRSALDSRETLYTVTDRVFAHYYRLRQGSRTARATPLASILDFLRSFYTRDEQRTHGLRYLLDGRVAEGALLSRLAMEGRENGQNFFLDEFPNRLQAYLSAATVDFGDVGLLVKRLNDEPEQVQHEFRQSSVGGKVDAAIRATIIAQSLYRLGHAEEAKQQIVKEIQVSNVDLTVYVILLLEYVSFRCSKRSHLKKNVELSMTLKEKELEQLPPLLRAHAYQALGWSLGYLGRHAEALEVFRSAVDLARQVGDMREEVVSLRLTASPLSKLGLYSEALQTYALVFGLARKITNLSQFLYAFIDCLLLAQRVPMPGISGLFAEAVLIARANPSLAVVAMHLDLHEVLIAALQAGELDAFDAVIAEHGDWLVNQRPPYVFREDGEHLAAIAAKDGRMAGWQAMASMLPRLAHLQALTPEPNRNRTWLRTLMTLFAGACRDPGLLRDVAGLLTPDLSPEAEASAALLRDLARVDEADVPERVLSRMDPDRALVIRRLRGLPDPEPPRRQGAGRKTRR